MSSHRIAQTVPHADAGYTVPALDARGDQHLAQCQRPRGRRRHCPSNEDGRPRQLTRAPRSVAYLAPPASEPTLLNIDAREDTLIDLADLKKGADHDGAGVKATTYTFTVATADAYGGVTLTAVTVDIKPASTNPAAEPQVSLAPSGSERVLIRLSANETGSFATYATRGIVVMAPHTSDGDHEHVTVSATNAHPPWGGLTKPDDTLTITGIDGLLKYAANGNLIYVINGAQYNLGTLTDVQSVQVIQKCENGKGRVNLSVYAQSSLSSFLDISTGECSA